MKTIRKSGIELIEEERKRQIFGEGWSDQHDDQHDIGQLASAAACYAQAAKKLVAGNSLKDIKETPQTWPWEINWWKPDKDPVRNLVKAGALIAAEIDRIQRKNK